MQKFTYPKASIKDFQATEEAFSPQKRTSSTKTWYLLIFCFYGSFLPSWIRIWIHWPDWIRIQCGSETLPYITCFFRKGWALACARCTWTSGRSLRCCACTWRRAALSAATTSRTGATSSAAASGSATIPASSSVERSHRSSAPFSHRAFTSSGRTGHLLLTR